MNDRRVLFNWSAPHQIQNSNSDTEHEHEYEHSKFEFRYRAERYRVCESVGEFPFDLRLLCCLSSIFCFSSAVLEILSLVHLCFSSVVLETLCLVHFCCVATIDFDIRCSASDFISICDRCCNDRFRFLFLCCAVVLSLHSSLPWFYLCVHLCRG